MNKQIEEMAKIMNETCNIYDKQGNHVRNKCSECECWSYDNNCCCSYNTKEAKALYNAGYRKIEDVAAEIFKEIESVSQIDYIINDAEIELIFAGEQLQYDCSVEALKGSKFLKKIVAISPTIKLGGEEAAISFDDFMRHGEESSADQELEARMSRLSENDLTTLIYTSGTTGEPKGVILRQSNYLQAMKIHDMRLTNVSSKDVSVCFLPLSHIFERAWTSYCLWKNVLVAVCKNPKEIQAFIPEVRPTVMCAVPRFWEKVYMGVNEKIESFPSILQKITHRAIKIGKKRNLEYRRYGKTVPTLLACQYWFYSHTLFHILKKVIGFDRGRLFPVAGAALSDDVNIFLHSVGFNICVGYGLTVQRLRIMRL